MSFDMERLTRRLQGGGSRPPIFRWVLVGLLVIFTGIGIMSSYYTVDADGKAVVKRFGRIVDVVSPGLHFKWPFGIETAQFVPTERVLKEEFGFGTQQPATRTSYGRRSAEQIATSLMLTGDLNVVDVQWVVQYRIREAEKWLHEVRDRVDTIRDLSESVMRRVVGNRLASDVLTVGRTAIALAVETELQTVFDSYDMGIRISSVELQDVTPPDDVKDAFNKVNEARQEKERLINVAEKQRNQVLPRAQGEAAQTLAEAEAYATERTNEAKGEASRFVALLAKYKEAPEITRQRMYLETIDKLGPQFGGVYVMGSGTAPLPLLNLLAPGGRAPVPAAPREEGR